MKRQKARPPRGPRNTRARNPSAAAQASAAPGRTRRDIFRKLGNGAVAFAAVGAAGWFVTAEVQATVREHDLSRIGNGVATVVQIHDPQCPLCVDLQRETREALCGFSEQEIQYLVANVRTVQGSAFARSHDVGHVTLLLLDGNGDRRDALVGPNTAEALAREFSRHVVRSAQR